MFSQKAILIILLLLIGSVILVFKQRSGRREEVISPPFQQPLLQQQVTGLMKLESSAFAHNQNIPLKYTCDGEDVSPPLKIFDVPKDAKSLVLIVDDPDAPRGDWVHWTVWNIAPTTNEIAENSVPQGAMQGVTDFGKPGYGGPCPPSGTHRYQFKLYALDNELNLSASAKKRDIEAAMNGHILEQAMLIGLYRRS